MDNHKATAIYKCGLRDAVERIMAHCPDLVDEGLSTLIDFQSEDVAKTGPEAWAYELWLKQASPNHNAYEGFLLRIVNLTPTPSPEWIKQKAAELQERIDDHLADFIDDIGHQWVKDNLR